MLSGSSPPPSWVHVSIGTLPALPMHEIDHFCLLCVMLQCNVIFINQTLIFLKKEKFCHT